MAIYRIKRFSFWEKTKAGLKGFGKNALGGAIDGGILGGLASIPFEKKLTKKIILGGAATGAIVRGGIGAVKSINDYNQLEKIKNDPAAAALEKEKIKKVINNEISRIQKIDISTTINSFKKFESEYLEKFRPDLFSYVKFYSKFINDNYHKWYKAYENLIKLEDFKSFYNIFPNPNFNYKYDDLERISNYEKEKEWNDNISSYFIVAGSNMPNHQLLYYNFGTKRYIFADGTGISSEMISRILTRHANQYRKNINDINKNRPDLVEVAIIHNQIIDEFINGLRSLR